MTLAERITTLRAEHNLSQGDLAEKIGVSRQSVSKWETGASIPELEKLILLADLFGITLDELVKGGAMLEVQVAEEKQTAAAAPKGYSTQKIIAVCLLLLGGIAAILGAALCPELLYLAGYLLLCSIVCFVVKRYAGLVIAWPTALGLALTAPYLFSVPVDFCVRWGSLTVAVLWTIWEVYKGREKCA